MFTKRTLWSLAALALLAVIVGATFGEADETGQPAMAGFGTVPAAMAPAGTSAPGPMLPAATGLPAAAGAGGGNFQTVQVIDGMGFSVPMLAFEASIPADWSATGGIAWNFDTGCHGDILNIEWMARSRDERQIFAMHRGLAWQAPQTALPTNPCPVLGITGIREFLELMATSGRPDVRVLDYMDAPEISRPIEEAREKIRREAAARGQPLQGEAGLEAGRLLIAYRENGVEVREILEAWVSISRSNGTETYAVPGVTRMRAPDGQLDFALFRQISDGMRKNLAWGEASSRLTMVRLQRFFDEQRDAISLDHQRRMAEINRQGMNARHAIRMQTIADVGNIYSGINTHTAATNNAIHQRTLERIGEYNTYAGVSGTTVRNSIHLGQRVFQHQDFPERVFSTDDPHAYPPAGFTELAPQR